MSFVFRPAVRAKTHLLIGLAGPSGSGKTLSALKLARGLVGGDDSKIFVIDTEAGRALHYACAAGEKPGPFRFAFQYVELTAPFSPARYSEVIQAAVAAGAGAVIVDSASHEHESTGGILEMHEERLTKLAGTDYAKRERMTFAAWIEPKALHNRFVNTLLQQRAHIILCFRAKDKMKLVKNDRGKMEPVQLGWTAICADRLEYEMACLLMLPPNGKGVPDLTAASTKLQEAHRGMFPANQPVIERAGEMLAAWARGSNSAPSAAPPPPSPAENAQAPSPRDEGAAGAASQEGGDEPSSQGNDSQSNPTAPATSDEAPAGDTTASGGYDAALQVKALWEGAERETSVANLRAYCQINEYQFGELKRHAPAAHAALGVKINKRLRDLKQGAAA